MATEGVVILGGARRTDARSDQAKVISDGLTQRCKLLWRTHHAIHTRVPGQQGEPLNILHRAAGQADCLYIVFVKTGKYGNRY